MRIVRAGASPGGVAARLAALTPRERVLVAIGAACLLLFLLYLMVWRGEADGGGDAADRVELAVPPPPAALPTSPPPAPPLPVVSAAPVSASSSPTAASLTLQGVSGGGAGGGAALFQGADGRQRLVRIGREIAPGTVLRSVGPTWAIATAGGADLRFELGRGGAAAVAAPTAPAPAALSGADLHARQETNDLRLGLQPLGPGGRSGGYQVKADANLPRLAQAGLRAGDIVTRVNGSMLDEERLLELSWQMSNSERVDLDVIRDGKPIKLTFQPGPAR